MSTLTVGGIIQNSMNNGIKYLVPLFVNALLWLLTIWIPYLNVGTTIGLFVGIAAKLARNEELSMTEIFNPVYRKRMGDFFLVCGLMGVATLIGFYFFIIPGIVMSVAWTLATLLVVDKGMNPTEAMTKSNDLTYGHKWTIFLGNLVVVLILMIAIAIVVKILGFIAGFLAGLGALAGMALYFSVLISVQACIYKELVK